MSSDPKQKPTNPNWPSKEHGQKSGDKRGNNPPREKPPTIKPHPGER